MLSERGAWLYFRFCNGGCGPWQEIRVHDLVGGPVEGFMSFEHQEADASGPARQVGVENSGFSVYSRVFAGGQWAPWGILSISQYGLPLGFSAIRSITHGLRPFPPYEPKEDVLIRSGQLLTTRVYSGGWGPWRTISIIELGILGSYLP